MDDLNSENWQKAEKVHRRGKILSGLVIVSAGALFLARELGAEIPAWIFSWKILLIVIGIVIAIKHRLRHPGWMVALIGGAFLLHDFYPEFHIRQIVWPILIILFGLFMIFRPRRRFGRGRHCRNRWQQQYHGGLGNVEGSKEDFIDSTSFCAGVKKNIISKKFRGGDITNVFGGTELNLMQSDFEGTAELEITQVFGGTKLVIPSNWEIRSELVTVFGGVEDKRPMIPLTGAEVKILKLSGTTFFGGIEIKSYS